MNLASQKNKFDQNKQNLTAFRGCHVEETIIRGNAHNISGEARSCMNFLLLTIKGKGVRLDVWFNLVFCTHDSKTFQSKIGFPRTVTTKFLSFNKIV